MTEAITTDEKELFGFHEGYQRVLESVAGVAGKDQVCIYEQTIL